MLGKDVQFPSLHWTLGTPRSSCLEEAELFLSSVLAAQGTTGEDIPDVDPVPLPGIPRAEANPHHLKDL